MQTIGSMQWIALILLTQQLLVSAQEHGITLDPAVVEPRRCFSDDSEVCLYRCHCMDDVACDGTTGDCPTSCADGWSGDGCQTSNVALGKSATQTSYRSIAGSNLPGNCVDGSPSMDQTEDTCCSLKPAHATRRSVEYWEVELGGPYVVDRIIILASQQYDGGATRALKVQFYLQDHLVHTFDTVNFQRVKNYTLTPSRVVDRLRMQKFESGYYFVMCEVLLMGYQYVECEKHQGHYYYGAACIHQCPEFLNKTEGCTDQCDYVTGALECTTCTTGYLYSDAQCTCQPCSNSTWGDECAGRCNCLDSNETCNHINGSCLESGCAQGYAGSGCDYALPRLENNIELNVIVDGRNVTVQFALRQDVVTRSAEDVVYKIGYQLIDEDEELRYQNTTWHHSNDGVLTGTVTLPSLRDTYSVCVVPYDLVVDLPGESGACGIVLTDCADGEYGATDCQHQCTCRDEDEACDKVTGRCTLCDDGVTGVDCKLVIPDEGDIQVNYEPGVMEIFIMITINAHVQNIHAFEVHCKGDNLQEIISRITVSHNDITTGVIHGLQSDFNYTCYIVPILIDNHGKYTGIHMHRQHLTTKPLELNTDTAFDTTVIVVIVVASLVLLVIIVVIILYKKQLLQINCHQSNSHCESNDIHVNAAIREAADNVSNQSSPAAAYLQLLNNEQHSNVHTGVQNNHIYSNDGNEHMAQAGTCEADETGHHPLETMEGDAEVTGGHSYDGSDTEDYYNSGGVSGIIAKHDSVCYQNVDRSAPNNSNV